MRLPIIQLHRVLAAIPLVVVMMATGVPSLHAGTIAFESSIDPKTLTLRETKSGLDIRLRGCSPVRDAAGFMLPGTSLFLRLPAGTMVTAVTATPLETREIAIGGQPIRSDDPAIPAQTDELISVSGRGLMGGTDVATLLLQGVAFDSARSVLRLHTRVAIEVETSPAPVDSRELRPLRESGVTRSHRNKLIESLGSDGGVVAMDREIPGEGQLLGDFSYFQPGEFPSLDGSVVEYLIITADALVPQLQRLADWKTRSGVPAVVRTIPWIEANYPGRDRPERIRNFIREAYRSWGTMWVLLGGDEALIPGRLARTTTFGGEDIPSDLYYSDLDKDWDWDGDGVFGEGWNAGVPGDSLDLYPDVFVGRAPIETVSEARNFVDKTLGYQRNPVLGYQNQMLFIAEVFFPFGWEPPDPPDINGCVWAHESGEYVPSTWDTTYLCEYPNDNESHESVFAALDEGPAFVSVMGHGDPFKWSTSDGKYFSIDDAMALSNYRKSFMIFYADCNTSQFETEAINEFLLLNPNGGAAGVIGATRVDFPTIGEYYQRDLFHLFFECGVREMGALLALMKVPRAYLSHHDVSYDRWTQLIYMLLGDPQLAMWGAVPMVQEIVIPASVAVGDTSFTVTVRKGIGAAPIPGAAVTVWKKDTGEYARGVTGVGGTVTFPFQAGSTGTVLVTSMHPDYLPKLDSLQVVAGAPELQVANVAVDDDSLGASAGNNDGILDAGERVELAVTLKNESGSSADSVVATLGLPATSGVRVAFDVDGIPSPRLLYVGEAGDRTTSLPLVLTPVPDSLVAWGKPLYTPRALEDSSGVSRAVSGRGYLWQDASGWHIRVAGGDEAHDFSGSFVAGGPILSQAPFDLEPGDLWTIDDDSLHFTLSVDSTDFEDGIDIVVGDSLGFAILSNSANFGSVAAGGETTRNFVIETSAHTADGRPGRFALDLAGAGGGLRTRGVRTDVSAPALHVEYNLIDDAAPGGNDNGLAEAGETVRISLNALNAGTGTALEVTATLVTTGGAVVLDSMTTLGTIAGGASGTGATAFRVALASDPVPGEIVFRTSREQEMRVPIELGMLSTPPTPSRPRDEAGGTWAEISWDPSPAADLRGYLVYRAPISTGAFTRVNEHLARTAFIRDEGLSPETAYRYRYAAVDSSGNRSVMSAVDTVWTGPALYTGFPVNAGNRMYASVVPVDVDVNGDIELFVATQGWRLGGWEHNGSVRNGFPRMLNQESFSSPAVGNLDSDPQREIVVGSSDRKVYAFNHNGTGLLSPNGLFGTTGGAIQGTPTLADLDRNGDLEVIVPSKDNWLYVWRKDGTGYLNPDGKFGNFGSACIGSPAVADVDGDGYLEIFVGTIFSSIYAWNHDGTGFRTTGGLFKYIGGGEIYASPVLGDLDLNGQMEVVAASMNDSVYVYNMSAVLKPGWPRGTGNSIHASPSLGDLDRDGKLEVVVGGDDKKLHVWRFNGAYLQGFPITLPDSVLGSPVIGDITGDGFPDVVCGCADTRVYAFQRNGQEVPGWPQRTFAEIWHSAAAITDLDRDGDVDIVQGSYDGYLHVWDLSVPYDASTMDWPMFQHDRTHSGFTGWVDPDGATSVGNPGGNDGSIPLVSLLREPAPNPAPGGTEIAFDLAREGRVRLAIYDVEGRLVERLVDERRAPGRYRVPWRTATGDAGVASGVYFVRMEAGAQSWSRKLVLIQ